MNFVQAFDKIKERLDGKAKISGKFGNFAMQIEMTNKDCGGIFYIKQENGQLDVEPYDYYDNDAAITVSYLSFSKIIDGRMTPDEAIAGKTFTINGNEGLKDALYNIIPAPKKPAAKATAKPEAKVAAKVEAKTEAKPEAKVAAKVEVKPEAKKACCKKSACKKPETTKTTKK